MKKLMLLLCVLITGRVSSQDLSSKSSDVSLDFTGSKNNYATSAPSIKWQQPITDPTYTKAGNLTIQLQVSSKRPLIKITLTIRDNKTKEIKGQTNIQVAEQSKNNLSVDRTISLPEGIDLLEIVAENEDGIKSTSSRTAYSGEEAVALATKLMRQDYALVFATDKYDHWDSLVNPIFDGTTISKSLQTTYGFKTEVVENPTREKVFLKLRQYAETKYNPLDQLVIVFAGHGIYDEVFKEGYVVPTEAIENDVSKTSYIRHSEIRGAIDFNPCQHILLVMDVCFGGTFADEGARAATDTYAEASQVDIIQRKLAFKTRQVITSGGKEYVSDGIKGNHSPFAKQFIAALESQGGTDGILTMSELKTYLEKLKTEPHFGRFGSDKTGSEFIFVVK
jgi:Caspase domain